MEKGRPRLASRSGSTADDEGKVIDDDDDGVEAEETDANVEEFEVGCGCCL